jgi:hypothetical protein
MTQLDLPLHPAQPKKTTARRMAARLIAILKARGGWITRRELYERHGFSRDGRQARAACEMAHGRIIVGRKGFKLLADATPNEIAATRNFYASMKRKLELKIKQLDKRSHGGVAGVRIA